MKFRMSQLDSVYSKKNRLEEPMHFNIISYSSTSKRQIAIFHGFAMREKINGSFFNRTRTSNGGNTSIEVSSWFSNILRALAKWSVEWVAKVH